MDTLTHEEEILAIMAAIIFAGLSANRKLNDEQNNHALAVKDAKYLWNEIIEDA